ncbi:hypothetical protein GCM10020255_068670 [Rhodococcus baikonurensis]
MVRIGAISGKDGWVVLHPADLAPITLNSPADTDVSELQKRILDLLSGGGAYFFRQLVDALRTTESAADTVDSAVTTALWELVWLGHIGNDTVAPLRALLSDTTRTTTSHRSLDVFRGHVRTAEWHALPPRPARDRRPLPVGGSNCRRSNRTRPSGRTPRPICCSNDTASSPADR